VYAVVVWNPFSVILGQDSSGGIATRYGLDGPGIESRYGARISAPVQTYPRARGCGLALTTHPHMLPRSKKE
jgi:hypothetical protein